MLRRSAISALLALTAGRSLALYDPKPDGALSEVQGEWKGSLTYRDYSKPDRLVTLPTRLFVALSAPNELVLHFVFDDGPLKTVYSYERMTFDYSGKQLSWTSGSTKKSIDVHTITASTKEGSVTTLNFERQSEGKTDRYSLALSSQRLQLTKEEVKSSGEPIFRNRYEFSRTGA
jgi:hypothetical protein